jgi:DNA-binding PadR family transcriptional regulator
MGRQRADIGNLHGEFAESYLYEYINKYEGLSIYSLSQRLNWSPGKVHYLVEDLEKEGLVRSEMVTEGGRLKRKVYPVHWTELLTEDEKRETLAEKESITDDYDSPSGKKLENVITV